MCCWDRIGFMQVGVPSTLHQCIVQWVGCAMEVIRADDSAYVALAETAEDLQDGEVRYLMGRDPSDFEYLSVGKNGFVPANAKPTMITHLENMEVNDE
jgi:hypothetical protein